MFLPNQSFDAGQAWQKLSVDIVDYSSLSTYTLDYDENLQSHLSDYLDNMEWNVPYWETNWFSFELLISKELWLQIIKVMKFHPKIFPN